MARYIRKEDHPSLTPHKNTIPKNPSLENTHNTEVELSLEGTGVLERFLRKTRKDVCNTTQYRSMAIKLWGQLPRRLKLEAENYKFKASLNSKFLKGSVYLGGKTLVLPM